MKRINVSEAIEFKKICEGILDACEKKVDLIIMGSHGTFGFDELLIEHNAEKVVYHYKIPVLAIKKKS